MATKTDITVETVRELLQYDPLTGEMTWRISKASFIKPGAIAGTSTKKGYRTITINYRIYGVHRLAWLMMTGSWPEHEIDHINGDPGDNRWINLRHATRSQNGMNTRCHIDNACGLKGVNWHKSNRRWRAAIKIDGRIKHLGLFDDKEAAHAAYQKAAEHAFGSFAKTL